MVKKFKTFGPQLVFAEQTAGSVVVTNEQKLSLYKKSQKSGISTDILEEVYRRGYRIWNESFGQTAEQFAFDRVNSFIAGGFAANLDEDLMINEGKKFIIYKRTDAASGGHQVPNLTFDKKDDAHAHIEKLAPGDYEVRKGWAGGTKTSRAELAKKIGMNEGKRGLWDNIHAKRERIKHGSGEHMRKPGSKGAPTDAAFKASQNEEADPCWDGYQQIGMKMKKGKKVPNCVPVKEAANAAQQAAIAIAMKKAGKKPKIEEESKIHTGKHFRTAETVEKQSKNSNDPDSRFDGTKSAKNVYQKSTPGQPVTEESNVDAERKTAERSKMLDDLIAQTKEAQVPSVKTSASQTADRRQFNQQGEVITTVGSRGEKTSSVIPNQATVKKQPTMTNALTTIKKVVRESYVCDNCDCGLHEEILNERGADSKGYYRSTESGAGLTAKGAKHFGIKTAVTTPPSKLKPGSKAANRRKSFCARMGGMKGPMKDEKGRPTRKAMSLRRWHC